MPERERRLYVGLASTLIWIFGSIANAAPPIGAFGDLPQIADVHMSPDGAHFSAIEPVNGRPAVLVFELHPAPGTKPRIYSLEDGNATGSTWVTDDRLLGYYYENKYLSESTGVNLETLARAVSLSLVGERPFMLMKGTRMYLQTQTAGILGRDSDRPSLVYMGAFRDGRYNLYSVDVEDNTVNTVEQGKVFTNGWLIDEHGHAVGRIDSTGEFDHPKNLDTFLAKDGNSWREAATFDNYAGSTASLEGIDMDGASLVVKRWDTGGRRILETLPIAAGEESKVLFSDPNYDVDDVVRDEWTGRVVGASYIGDKREYRYFDPVLAHIQARLEKALPAQSVQISSWDKKRNLFLITAEDPHDPPGIYLFTPAKGTLEYLMSAYPSLQPADLGDVKAYPYKSRDGLDIHAYLTLPPGKQAHSLPTVVFPHGGPDDRDSIRFDWWAQFMASRGYAVLQPNFRGSTGYGRQFRDAGYGQWGRKMQDDITDGVRKLIADGIADPKRFCIVGASYGGYAALAGATFTPDLYACAVSYAGIADVSQIIGQAAGGGSGEHSEGVRYWELRVGNRYENVKELQESSPALHAEKVKAPILLLHNNADITVPYTQSLREQTALEEAGKQVQVVILKGDDHYLNHADARMRVLTEIETFLKAHIGQ